MATLATVDAFTCWWRNCPLTTRSRQTARMYRLNAAYLFERRQVAGAVPNAFLKAREKAASEP